MKNVYVVCSFTVYLLCFVFMGALLLTQINFVKQKMEQLSESQKQYDELLKDAMTSFDQMEASVSAKLSWLEENQDALSAAASGETTADETDSSDVKTSKYYLRMLNGYITVFQGGTGEIKFETSISEDSLTEEQLKRLTKGIGLDSLLDVYNYLESYTS